MNTRTVLNAADAVLNQLAAVNIVAITILLRSHVVIHVTTVVRTHQITLLTKWSIPQVVMRGLAQMKMHMYARIVVALESGNLNCVHIGRVISVLFAVANQNAIV